jgi:hypothetical protein
MAREEFSAPTRRLIAEHAGHQCSFPTCNRRTVGPGPVSSKTSSSGYAAHIYSAASGGPRGQGGLTAAELSGPGNGIWLCGRHSKLADNNRGAKYSPETLLSYKALQESRVSLEHEGLYSPVGWLHELTIIQSPLFAPPQTIGLAKLNLFYGNNGTGKSAITEWINGFFDAEALRRWISENHAPLELRLSFLSPKLQQLRLTAQGGKLRYFIDGTQVAFIPIGLRVLRPERLDYSECDDLRMVARALRMPPELVRNLADEVNAFPYTKVSSLRFEVDEDGDTVLLSDVEGTAPGLSLRALSSGESERVMLELVTAAARLSGRYSPTLLVLDEFPSIIFKEFFEYYSHHLLDPGNQFQTFMCIPERDLDLDGVRWNGWEVVRTEGSPPLVRISQEVRVIKT